MVMSFTLPQRHSTTTLPAQKTISRSSTAPGNHVTLSVVSANALLQEVAMQALNAFVTAIRDIPTVEQVRAQTAGAYVHIVTYMSDSTLEQRYAVYDAQSQLYRQYPALRLEFDLIDREGYPVEHDELTGKTIEIIRELPDRNDTNAIHESD